MLQLCLRVAFLFSVDHFVICASYSFIPNQLKWRSLTCADALKPWAKRRGRVNVEVDEHRRHHLYSLHASCHFGIHLHPPTSPSHSWTHATRVGEATNPGPADNAIVIGQINPTAVLNKAATIAELGLHVAMLAETSATVAGQQIMTAQFRHHSMRTHWGPPVYAHNLCHLADDALRGQASGVSIHAVFPLRSTRIPIPDIVDPTRITSAILQIGHHVWHLIEVYGYPTSHAFSKDKTNLLLQVAAQLADAVNLPTLIGGDFNRDPALLPAFQALQLNGYVTSNQCHRHMYGIDQPWTCKEATFPDQYIIHPKLLPFLQAISVDKQKFFADHDPVLLHFQLPDHRPLREIWPSPETWITHHLDASLLAQVYAAHQPPTPEPPSDDSLHNKLLKWTKGCESAVDKTLRLQHQLDQAQFPTPCLPRKCRGRMTTTKLQKRPLINVIKQACAGQFNPVIESASMTLKHWTRQLRRLQSFRFRYVKLQHCLAYVDTTQLTLEWNAIAAAKGFYQGFPSGCAHWPELAYFPTTFPDVEYLDHLIELLRLQTEDKAYQESQMHKAHSAFAKRYDDKQQCLKVAARRVRAPSMPFLSEVNTTQQYPFRLIARQHGLLTLSVGDALVPLHRPLYCDHIELQPFAQQGELLEAYIQDDGEQVPEAGTLSRQEISQDPVQIADQLRTFWDDFWNRDPVDSLPSDQFRQLLEEVPQLPDANIDVADPTLWIDAIHHMKTGAAKGADGWSVAELKQLPQEAYRDLANIFHSCSDEGFDAIDMTVFTLPIGKNDHPIGPKDTRPISLLIMLYRLWARVTTKQLLQQLSHRLPEAIVGYVPGRSMTATMVKQQYDFELAQMQPDTPPWIGTTLDIVKCFNAIQRCAAAAAMALLGIPPFWIRFWLRSQMKLNRYWKLHQTMIYHGSTSTGVAEGDSWSILACLSLSYIWCWHMQRSHLVICLIFADNWSWKTQNADEHARSFAFTRSYTASIYLSIDWHKTWQWHTPLAAHRALQQELKQLVPETEVHTLQAARELGFTMHYTGRQTRETQQQRHQKALARIHRIRHHSAPIEIKAQLCQHAITQALYATETYVVGQQWLKELRSAIARVLSPGRRNTNPHLALTLLSKHVTDPELFVILISVKACRVMLWSMSSEERAAFCTHVARHPATYHSVKGPAGVLAFNLLKLGWTLNARGDILTHTVVKLHLWFDPWQDIQSFALISWMQHVVQDVLTRPDLAHIPVPDIEATVRQLGKREPADQLKLSYSLTGGHMLAQQAQHFAGVEDVCRFCGGEDTIEHRLLACEPLNHVRAAHPAVVEFLTSHDPSHLALPSIFLDAHWELQWLIADNLPEPDLNDQVLAAIEHMVQQGQAPWFYTDGSCTVVEHRLHACAAYAVICHAPIDLSEQTRVVEAFAAKPKIPDSFRVLATGVCPRRQTVPRSELAAALLVAELEVPAIIFTDSQYVLDIAAFLLTRTHEAMFHATRNFDLLRRFWTALRTGRLILKKVKAHALNVFQDPVTNTFHKLGNEAADHAAKLALSKHPLREELAQRHSDHENAIKDLNQHWDYRLHLNQQRAILLEQHLDVADKPQTRQSWQDQLVALKNWNLEHWVSAHVADFQDPRMDACLYGTRFCRLLLQWWSLIRWSTEQPATDDPGVTWVELTLSFKLATQTGVVVNSSQKGYQTFKARQLDLNPTDVPFTQQSFSLERAISQMHRLLNLKWEASRNMHCRSVRLLGNQHGKPGLLPRPEFPCHQQVVQLLQPVLQHEKPDLNALHVPCEKFKETRELVAKIQALKEEGTTSVTAVFLAPPDTAPAPPKAAPAETAEGPAPMEVPAGVVMDGIGLVRWAEHWQLVWGDGFLGLADVFGDLMTLLMLVDVGWCWFVLVRVG
eukprot:Skav213045  [mRNA]  locus=scaffold844:829204:837168:+ [translate_table: standard]